MQLAEPVARSVESASSRSSFEQRDGTHGARATRATTARSSCRSRSIPKAPSVCHAIVVHPPGGIAGGDELALDVDGRQAARTRCSRRRARPSGIARRARGRRSTLAFDVDGQRWNGCRRRPSSSTARSRGSDDARSRSGARRAIIGWEIVCLGRTGSGERFARGRCGSRRASRERAGCCWSERGEIEGGGGADALAGGPRRAQRLRHASSRRGAAERAVACERRAPSRGCRAC